MFTRYNINDLYLAYVLDITPCEGNFLPYRCVGYLTILKKNGEDFIDLQNKGRIVKQDIIPNEKCYAIYECEPLSKHYTQDGNKRNNFTRT